jgi:transcriptional regulator GlxA family with amidase domain
MTNDDDEIEALWAAIIASLMSGQANMSAIAQRMNTSVRTLQRRLGNRGTTFSKVLEDVRVKAAQSMLGETDMPLTAIAESLGYSKTWQFLPRLPPPVGLDTQELSGRR